MKLRQDRLAVALLLLIPTLFFSDVLLGFGNFYMRDLTRYYYPTKQIYREVALGGALLWAVLLPSGKKVRTGTTTLSPNARCGARDCGVSIEGRF